MLFGDVVSNTESSSATADSGDLDLTLSNAWTNPVYLAAEQYVDATRLASRANLHAKYGRGDWFEWLAGQIDWPLTGEVLEVGCGAGWFWAAAASLAPAALRLTLSDISGGMVAEAVRRARDCGRWVHVEGRLADASNLPFADAAFDIVIASHMLYHLADPAAGVAQIARVLRPGGLTVIATNGQDNMRELFALQGQVFGPSHAAGGDRAFTLEKAANLLPRWFGRVETRHYPDRLVCTDQRDVLDYLLSSPPADRAPPPERERLAAAVSAAFDAGGGRLIVTKCVGAHLCRAGT